MKEIEAGDTAATVAAKIRMATNPSKARKSVTNRVCIILAETNKQGIMLILKDENEQPLICGNRDVAKNFIINNQNDLIEKYGIDAKYTIALLDWNVSFKQDDIKVVINK